MTYSLYFDGACTGNPGSCAYGYLLDLRCKKVTGSEYIGHGTNNEAEYTALIRGLERALEENVYNICVKGDSQLIVKQIKGEYKVNAENLLPLYKKAVSLTKKFSKFKIEYIPRKKNYKADKLANKALGYK